MDYLNNEDYVCLIAYMDGKLVKVALNVYDARETIYENGEPVDFNTLDYSDLNYLDNLHDALFDSGNDFDGTYLYIKGGCFIARQRAVLVKE